MRHHLAWLPLAAMLAAASSALADAPRVVATIPPIHSLVASIMQGVGEPHLLLRGNLSPHAYQMRPSDAQSLQEAQIVFWVGPAMEAFLAKPLASLATGARAVELMDSPGVELLSARTGGVWPDEDEHEEVDSHHHDDGVDAHIWLNPQNAAAMARTIAAVLRDADPANAAAYTANETALVGELDELQEAVEVTLAPVRGRPFVVFHDAFQHLEHAFGLAGAGALTISPERAPSAARVRALRSTIVARDAVCVFREPQFDSAMVAILVEGTGARTGVLDPLGAALEPGPALYHELLEVNATALRGCLAPAG